MNDRDAAAVGEASTDPEELRSAAKPFRPRLGIQGPVVGWPDPWAGPASDAVMRTGTGVLLDSQDQQPSPQDFLGLLIDLGADFYVHHVMPDLTGQTQMLRDTLTAGIEVVLGNEYGNINGPYVEGTNRYDIATEAIVEASKLTGLAGVLYDEPEHLQINAAQYRKDAFLQHFANTAGVPPRAAATMVTDAARARVDEVTVSLLDHGLGPVPVLAEQVFPVLFHPLARAGLTPCPKVMKEAFQPLQLATALGASLQYERGLWICADLWGPDVGPWFTRAPGFPGHSPEEYASALRMAYLFAPDALFTENVDALARHRDGKFAPTEFGEVWAEFVNTFVPAHPLHWRHSDARPSILLIYADDSNYGQGDLPFEDSEGETSTTSNSIFEVWHLLSRGSIPATGSCLHITGYDDFPRYRLDSLPRSQFPLSSGVGEGNEPTRNHPLFHPINNVLVLDETADPRQFPDTEVIIVAGSRLPARTLGLLRSAAHAGATVIVADWLTDRATRSSQRVGRGLWVVTTNFLADDVVGEVLSPHVGRRDRWIQRFGSTEIRMTPADQWGTTMDFEIVPA